MVNVGDLSRGELHDLLAAGDLRLRTGPFVTRIETRVPTVVEGIGRHYAAHPLETAFADFHVRIARAEGVRGYLRPQVVFEFDGQRPFKPLPADHAFPMLEWGLNWCIAGHYHALLILHAACVAQGTRAAILPAPPGSGKSTLCAGLVASGWRLLSDELALVDLASGALAGVARPISLKNDAIDVVRAFAPQLEIGRPVHDTTKGTVAHVKPPDASVRQVHERAQPRWVIVPKFVPDAKPELAPLTKGNAFMRLVDSAFNYSVLGQAGFEAVARVVDAADCYEFSYSRLTDAASVFEELANARG